MEREYLKEKKSSQNLGTTAKVRYGHVDFLPGRIRLAGLRAISRHADKLAYIGAACNRARQRCSIEYGDKPVMPCAWKDTDDELMCSDDCDKGTFQQNDDEDNPYDW
ncbi:hypothetical protein MTO96_022146 [Rhipicephalus appendiculatus]